MLATKIPAVTIRRFSAKIWLSSEGLFIASTRVTEVGVAPGAESGLDPMRVRGYMDDTRTWHGSRRLWPRGLQDGSETSEDMNQATQSTWKAGLRTTTLLAPLTGL